MRSACALPIRSEEHTSELQSHANLVCRLLLERKKNRTDGRRMLRRGRRGGAPTRAPAARALREQGARPRARVVPRLSARLPLFFNDTATTEIYPLPLHDALPI